MFHINKNYLKLSFHWYQIFICYVPFCKTIDDVTFQLSLRHHFWPRLKKTSEHNLGVFYVPSLPRHGYRDVRRWLSLTSLRTIRGPARGEGSRESNTDLPIHSQARYLYTTAAGEWDKKSQVMQHVHSPRGRLDNWPRPQPLRFIYLFKYLFIIMTFIFIYYRAHVFYKTKRRKDLWMQMRTVHVYIFVSVSYYVDKHFSMSQNEFDSRLP